MASLIVFGVRIITLVNAILLRSSLSIRQKQQGCLEVDGRYVAVNVAASAKSARMTDIFGVNEVISFFTINTCPLCLSATVVFEDIFETLVFCNFRKNAEFLVVLSFTFK